MENIKGFDLCFADSQDPCLFGLNKEFISSPRMDNLNSTFNAYQAFIEFSKEKEKMSKDVPVFIAFNHEEVGSKTYVGAASHFVMRALERIAKQLDFKSESDLYERMISRSIIISADMAHGLHPNFKEKHQRNHKTEMNKGLVIKINWNGNYTTDAIS